jgi:hypothetical protein
MPLAEDRNTPHQDGDVIVAPVATGVKCFAGGIACANAGGFATPGATATGLTYLGRFDESVDNTIGTNGAVDAMVRRKKSFKWKNSGADPVTQASLGKVCYIVDDETVAATSATSTRSAAGVVVELSADGVWVE